MIALPFTAPLWLTKIPKWVWWMLAGAVVLGLVLWRLDSWGDARYEKGRSDLLAEQREAADKIEDAQVAVTTRVVTEYVDRIVEVRVQGETIIKEAPVYVTAEDDLACTINNGFVRLWNDANVGKISNSPAGVDGSPSGVSLSEVGTQKAREAQYTRELEQQLISLQDWVSAQQKLNQ